MTNKPTHYLLDPGDYYSTLDPIVIIIFSPIKAPSDPLSDKIIVLKSFKLLMSLVFVANSLAIDFTSKCPGSLVVMC